MRVQRSNRTADCSQMQVSPRADVASSLASQAPWRVVDRTPLHFLSLRRNQHCGPAGHASDKSSNQQAASTWGREKIFPIFSGNLF